MIPRKVEAKLRKIIEIKEEFNNVLLIEGARQVGKTTLVRQALSSLKITYKEINLEEKRELAQKMDLVRDFDEFTELLHVELNWQPGSPEILFIDEAQESSKIGAFIRFMKEKWKNSFVIISGSILSRIFRDDIRYPVGRVTHIHLQPFDFEEFLLAANAHPLLALLQNFTKNFQIAPNTHQHLLEQLDQYMEVGGLPEVVTTYFEKKDWNSVRNDILLGYYNDFKRVAGEERQAYLMAALKAVASLLGSPFKNSYVAALLEGGKNKKIIEALSQLEAWKMILKVEQKGSQPEKNFHPKRYLFDIGLAKELREQALPQIRLLGKGIHEKRAPLGGLIENITASILQSETMGLAGWKKSSSGSEVDFLVKHKNGIVPIECKAATKIKNTHLGGLLDGMQILAVPVGILVSLAPFEVRKFQSNKTILLIPLYLASRWDAILSLV